MVIEDDYDAEFRYDRAPLGAMQGLAPDRVVYMGTVSKTLAPALRLGWLVLPSRLLEAVARQKLLSDHGSPTIDQLALARLLDSGAYDRHLRQARRRYRSRRDALVAAVARHLPGARVTGLAAGLHAIVRLAAPVDGLALAAAASRIGRRLPAGLRLHGAAAGRRRARARLRQPGRAGDRGGHPPAGPGAGGAAAGAGGDEAGRRDRQVVVEHPAAQPPVLEAAHESRSRAGSA